MRCDQCKHWPDKSAEWEPEKAGMRKCAAMRPRWHITDDASANLANDTDAEEENYMTVRRDALRAARAYVQDGSEYTASFWTMPDFFCALFDQK